MGIVPAVICILLVIAALVGICLLSIKVRKDWPSKDFDERQKQSINEGYQVAYWVGFLYFSAVMIACIGLEAGEELPVAPYLLLYAGIMLQIAVLHIHNLLTHSAMPLSSNPKTEIVGFPISGCIMLWGVWNQGKRYEGFPLRGEGTIKWFFLIGAVTFFLRSVGHLLTLFWKEKEEE